MRRAVVACAIVAVALAAPSSAAERGVAIQNLAFAPSQLVIGIGDTVTWTNRDAEVHTVTADDGSFDSRDLAPGGVFSLTFTQAGRVTYHCETHPRRMLAEVVVGVVMTGPVDPVKVGEQFVLTGLAPPQLGTVAIERRVMSGDAGVVGRAEVAADGTFRISLVADQSAEYRAVADSLVSDPVRVTVSPRLMLRVQRTARATRVHVIASPPQPRASVVLERYAPERFAWAPLARGRLDASSKATFIVRPRRRMELRVSMPQRDDRFAAATSNVVVVPRSR